MIIDKKRVTCDLGHLHYETETRCDLCGTWLQDHSSEPIEKDEPEQYMISSCNNGTKRGWDMDDPRWTWAMMFTDVCGECMREIIKVILERAAIGAEVHPDYYPLPKL